MKKPQIYSLYEYSNKSFDRPISAATSLRLNELIARLEVHVKGKVLERILNSRNETIGIRAFQYVGVIHVDSTLSIEVLPKMYRPNESDSDERKTSIDNLFYMLDYCGQISLPSSHASQLKRIRGSFFETLIFLFASDLMSCIQNATHHEYIEREENLPYIKGKLLISQHVKYNSVNQSRFYLKSDEFTADNSLNRVLKYVSRMLLSATDSSRNRHLLAQVIGLFDEVSDVRIAVHNAERINLTRLNIRFEQSLRLSKLFLSGKSLQLSASNHDSFTFLIDMNNLFEDFIATALRKSLIKYAPSNMSMKSQKPIKNFVEHTQYEATGMFRMKPDISVLENDTVVKIIDTKYKMLTNDRKQNVSQADLYQMFAYAKKYETGDITLLYPRKPDEEIRETDYTIDESCVIKIRTFDLQRSLKNDGKKFELDMYRLAMQDVPVLYQ